MGKAPRENSTEANAAGGARNREGRHGTGKNREKNQTSQ